MINERERNIKQASDDRSGNPGSTKVPYSQNLVSGQFVVPASFSYRMIYSALAHFVVNVLLIGSKKKMIGVHAFWNITPVQHMKSVWDIASMHLPGKSMSFFLSRIDPNHPISFRVNASDPEPTKPSLFDLSPKANFRTFFSHGGLF